MCDTTAKSPNAALRPMRPNVPDVGPRSASRSQVERSIMCPTAARGCGAEPRIQSSVHHVQANLPAAKTTTPPMRNRKIKTAKFACFLNSLTPSLIRVVRRKKIERTKRKSGIAAAMKAMILKIIVQCQCRVNPRRYSITSSAWAEMPDGTSRPSVLAVLRLITDSNFVDCITGRHHRAAR